MTQSLTPAQGAPVSLRGITKRFGDFAAVADVNLDIEAGEFLTLLGASGSGKTTTLSMIAGFLQPTEGTVTISDRDVTAVPPHRRGLGMVFQQYSLFPHMSVLANVAFPLKQRGVASAERMRRARAALEVVELDGRADSRPRELSGGQQQRVAIARALVFSPGVLLMDEPFGALDRALRERMQIEVRRIHQEFGTTIVFVTHDQQEALTLSNRIAVFDRGRIIQVGTPVDLYEQPSSLEVGTFIGESNLIEGTWSGDMFVARSGARLPVRAGGATTETTGSLFVRPENVRLSTVPDGDGLSGTVRDIAYLGSDRRLEVETADTTMIVRLPSSISSVRQGDAVTLDWDAENASVFTSGSAIGASS